MHYEYDVQIYKNTIIINAYFTMDYIRDTVSGKARIIYQSTPVVDILDITGQGEAYDLQYGLWRDWRNPTNAWVSFYPMGAIRAEKCWLKGYADGDGHCIDYKY